MNFERQDVADACRRHCVDVRADLLDGYDPAQLLWAICGNESSYGEDCTPRHESAYDVGGTYAANATQAALLEKYGRAGACSYGPMQVMLVNAPAGYAPSDFDDLDKAIAAGVYALNRLLEHGRPTTLAQIAACYNAGHVPNGIWPTGVHRYANSLIVNYGDAMPEPVLRG